MLPILGALILQAAYGAVDLLVVGQFGSTAGLSAVSTGSQVLNLVTFVVTQLAMGVTVLIARYLGEQNEKQIGPVLGGAAVVFCMVSAVLFVLLVCFARPIAVVMQAPEEAVELTASYVRICGGGIFFIVAYNLLSAIFRGLGDSRSPLLFVLVACVVNVAGDLLLVAGFGMDAAGAAIATLGSRVISAVVVFAFLHNPSQEIAVRDYLHIRPDGRRIMRILSLGIPNGIENAMFQFGKLAIQSTVSTLGTIAIAAQAMTNILENLNGIAAIGIGIGMMTVVGQCLGAGRKDEAIYYIKKLTAVAEVVIIASCALVFLATKPVTILGGMEPESAKMCLYMVGWITVVKPIVWTLAFIPAYGMRAAGDVRFSMILSCISMWAFRVTLCIYLCRVHGFGPIAVWIGMFTDWTIRGIIYTIRFKNRKWLAHQVI